MTAPKPRRRVPPVGRRGYSKRLEADLVYILAEAKAHPWVPKVRPVIHPWEPR